MMHRRQTSKGTASSTEARTQDELGKAVAHYKELIVQLLNKTKTSQIPQEFLIVGGKKENNPKNSEEELERIKGINSDLISRLVELEKTASTEEVVPAKAPENSTSTSLNAQMENELRRQYMAFAKELNQLELPGIPRLANQPSRLDILRHANQLMQWLTANAQAAHDLTANAQAAHDLTLEKDTLKVLMTGLGFMEDRQTKAKAEGIIANAFLQYMEAGNDQERATVLRTVNEGVRAEMASSIKASAAARLHSKTSGAPGPSANAEEKPPIMESDTESLSEAEIVTRMQRLADFIKDSRNVKRP
jgi:hypothetical protein